MKATSQPGLVLQIALLLFGLLTAAVVYAATRPGELDVIALHRLTPHGILIEPLEADDETAAYEQLLRAEATSSWLGALRQRLSRHGALHRAELHAKKGDLQGAHRELMDYLARHPTDLKARWRVLEASVAKGNHAAVIKAADELLSWMPGFGPALLRRARARQLLGEELSALHDFMRALERPLLAPDFASAATATLQLLVDRGEPELARHYAFQLQEAAFIAQSAPFLGYAAHALGEHDVAAAHFRDALRTRPSPRLTLALAQSLSLAHQQEEAVELLLGASFSGKLEQERWRMLSRLAGELGLEGLAMTAADVVVKNGDDPELRLELAQRLLDQRPASREASEHAWLLLADAEQQPCTEALEDVPRCQRLAAEALRRLGRHEELASLLRSKLATSDDHDMLAQLGLALLDTEPGEGALVFASLAAVTKENGRADEHQGQAAEVLLGAGAAHLSLSLLDSFAPRDFDERVREVELYAAQQAKDWQRLVQSLESQPFAKDNLPENDGHAGAYCDALAALESPRLQSCLERLARRHPANAQLRYRIAALARDKGDIETALAWLKQATQLRAEPRWLLEEGFLLESLQQPRQAEERFRAAHAAGAGSEAEIALAYSLVRRGREGAAVHHLRHALAQADLADHQRLPALELLAQLLQQAGAPQRAGAALQAALELEEDPERRLRLARAQYEAGQTAAAQSNLQQIERARLGPQASLLWLDLAGDLATRDGKLDAAIQMRQAAAALGPTAVRHELLASALLKRNGIDDRRAAREHLAVAVALSDQAAPSLLARLAYLDQSAGDVARAELLLREAVRQAPQVQEYREDLAQLLANQGKQTEAVPLLRAALEAAADHPDAEQDYRRERVARLQAQHVASTRRWRAQWLETFCIGSQKDCVRPSLTSVGDSIGQGQAEVGFIPFLSDRFGLVELTARVNWDRAPGKFASRGRYLQGALGFRYKALRDHDLWVGGERLQAIGPGGRNDWRLFASYGWSRGREWSTAGHGLRPYLSFYGMLGRNFGGDQERSAFGEVQVGFRGQKGETFAYLPFIYLGSRREQTRDFAFYSLEAGIGINSDWRFGKDLYDGYLTTAGLSLRLGHERVSRGKSATRGILSLSLRY